MRATVQNMLEAVGEMTTAQVREFVTELRVAGPWESVPNDEDEEHPFWFRPWLRHPFLKLEDDAAVDLNMVSMRGKGTSRAPAVMRWQITMLGERQPKAETHMLLAGAKIAADGLLRKAGVLLLDS